MLQRCQDKGSVNRIQKLDIKVANAVLIKRWTVKREIGLRTLLRVNLLFL